MLISPRNTFQSCVSSSSFHLRTKCPIGVIRASVALVVREGKTLVPDIRTVLRSGDDLLVVTPRRLREQTEHRLRAVSLRGRLAHWLDG